MRKEVEIRGKKFRVRASSLEDELFIEKSFAGMTEKYKNIRMTILCTQTEIENQPGVFRGITDQDMRGISSSDFMRLERETLLLDIPDEDPIGPAIMTVLSQLPEDAPEEIRGYLTDLYAKGLERRGAEKNAD